MTMCLYFCNKISPVWKVDLTQISGSTLGANITNILRRPLPPSAHHIEYETNVHGEQQMFTATSETHKCLTLSSSTHLNLIKRD